MESPDADEDAPLTEEEPSVEGAEPLVEAGTASALGDDGEASLADGDDSSDTPLADDDGAASAAVVGDDGEPSLDGADPLVEAAATSSLGSSCKAAS